VSKAIRVDVVGFTGSGRSTVMRIIADALKWHNIAATVKDEKHNAAFAVNQQRRIASLVEDGLTVEINQVFAHRANVEGGHGGDTR